MRLRQQNNNCKVWVLFAALATCQQLAIKSSEHWGCEIFIGAKAPRTVKFTDESDQAERMPGMLLEAGGPEGLTAASEDVSASSLYALWILVIIADQPRFSFLQKVSQKLSSFVLASP